MYLHASYGISATRTPIFPYEVAVSYQEDLYVSSTLKSGSVATISYRTEFDRTIGSLGGSRDTVTTVPFTMASSVGETLYLNMALEGGTSASAVGGSASAFLDAGHTGMLTLALTTPGASYTTQSGTDYSTFVFAPVPEPMSAVLLLAGLGFVTLARQRLGPLNT